MSYIHSEYIKGFPLDSKQVGYHDDGFPAYSNEYKSSDYRMILSRLISSGIISEEGKDPLKVYIASGSTSSTLIVAVKAGSAMINGGLFIIPGTTPVFSIAAPTLSSVESSRTKTTYIYASIVSYNGEEKAALYTYEASSSGNVVFETPPRYNYMLCLARVVSKTTKNGTSYSYQHSVTDLRASEYCGWAAPFVDVDTSAYYDAVQQVVNESKAEVEATIPTLLENAQESVDSAISNLEEQTQTAIDLAQGAIDGTLYGQLDTKIDGIEDKVPAYLNPMVEIPNGADLNNYVESGSFICKRQNVSSLVNRPSNVIFSEALILYVSRADDTTESYNGDIVSQVLIHHGRLYSRYLSVNNDTNKYTGGSVWALLNNTNIETGNIKDSAITTPKIADGAVTQDKLADDINLGGEVEDGSITTQKLADNSVTEEKLSQTLQESLSQSAKSRAIYSIDLNIFKENGIFWVDTSCTNMPDGVTGMLINMSWLNGIRGYQIFINTRGIKVRDLFTSAGWSEWYTL